MKVSELIKQLKKYDQDSYVVIQEYNGAEDTCRLAKYVVEITPQRASLNPKQSKIVGKSSILMITAIRE